MVLEFYFFNPPAPLVVAGMTALCPLFSPAPVTRLFAFSLSNRKAKLFTILSFGRCFFLNFISSILPNHTDRGNLSPKCFLAEMSWTNKKKGEFFTHLEDLGISAAAARELCKTPASGMLSKSDGILLINAASCTMAGVSLVSSPWPEVAKIWGSRI